ncbi:MAG: hypothetical protein AAGK78_11440, partial [Planctomycetota bacterium]
PTYAQRRVEQSRDVADRYAHALRREISSLGVALDGRGRVVAAHFCNSPLRLSADAIERGVCEIENAVGLTDDVVISIEVCPFAHTENEISAMARSGRARVFAVVSSDHFQPAAFTGKRTGYHRLEAAFAALRAAGCADISAVLSAGTEHVDWEQAIWMMEAIIALGPDCVVLTDTPSTVAIAHLVDLSSAADAQTPQERLAAISQILLPEAGFRRLGGGTYMKPDSALQSAMFSGCLRRSAHGFADDAADISIGVGAGASVHFSSAFTRNERRIDRYMERMEQSFSAVAYAVELDDFQQAVAKAASLISCGKRGDLTPAFAAATPTQATRLQGLLSFYEQQSVIEIDDRAVVATTRFRPVADAVADALLAAGGALMRPR